MELIKRELSLTQWMKGVEITEKLRERNIPLEETLQCVEAATELSDPEFRKAAYATLGLMKKAGKTPGEAETYIEELSSQIEGRRKEKSEWDENGRGITLEEFASAKGLECALLNNRREVQLEDTLAIAELACLFGTKLNPMKEL